MSTVRPNPMNKKNLPPLQVDTDYEVVDFERFEYSSGWPAGNKPRLRLHLKNRCILNLPVQSQDLVHLMRVLIDAFPQDAAAHFGKRPPSS